MTETPQTPIAEDDFDLDEWLSTGTLARRAVPIYNDPALAAEYDVLAMEVEAKERAVVAGMTAGGGAAEAAIGEGADLSELYEQMAALHERWEASKATWVVRALTEDEAFEVAKEHPDPEIPAFLAVKREPGTTFTDEQRAEAVAFQEARAAAVTERNLAMIARAVVEVRTARGVRRSVSIEQIRTLRSRPHGKTQTLRLLQAVESATAGEVEVPRPTSPGRSQSDRG